KADPAKLVAAIAAVVAELPSEGEPVVREPVGPESALSPSIEVPGLGEVPVETAELPELAEAAGAATDELPEPEPAVASLVELPELGGAPTESPAAAWLDNAGSDD